jgi:hypothetical protein
MSLINFGVMEVRQTEFSVALNRLREGVRRGLIDPKFGTLPEQARLLTERCMAMTPPKTLEQGENRTAKDITSIIKGRDPAYLDFVVELTGKTTNVRQELKTKAGVPYLIDVDVIDQSGSQIAAWHEKHRDKRRGRVWRGSAKNMDDKIGRWRARDTLWVPGHMLKAYLAKMKAHVGTAKAGWLKAYTALGGTRAPDWVLRQSQRQGVFVNGLNNPKPFIEVRNASKWGVRNNNSADIVSKALSYRARDMQRYLDKMMDLARRGIATPFQAAAASLTRAA